MEPNLLANPALKPVFHGIGRTGLRIFGWKIHGRLPKLKKFILIAAPHTTNWDFVFFLLIVFTFGIPIHWMGKHTMFIPFFRQLLKKLGGIPIDRSRQGNTVNRMADKFHGAEQLIVTIAPSGTRGNVARWKTGFYRIAHKAGVPIVCGYVDYKKKIGGIGPTIIPSGDLEKDMARIQDFYRDKAGRYD